MKMPTKIETIMFAPCGMNCQLCEKHLNKTNPCPGCLIKSSNKTKSVLKCKIRECLNKKTFKYCGRCSEFPCKLIKKQDKNNRKRYNYSSLESAKRIKNTGINKMINKDMEKWTCNKCNGIIAIQTKECSECGKKFN